DAPAEVGKSLTIGGGLEDGQLRELVGDLEPGPPIQDRRLDARASPQDGDGTLERRERPGLGVPRLAAQPVDRAALVLQQQRVALLEVAAKAVVVVEPPQRR